MDSRSRILALRAADPTLPAATIAREIHKSRAWVGKVLAQEKLPTITVRSHPHKPCPGCGGYCEPGRRGRKRLCYACKPPRQPVSPEARRAYEAAYHRDYYRRKHPIPPPRVVRLCTIDGCGRTHRARGLCRPHYAQEWRWLRIARQGRPWAGLGVSPTWPSVA